MMVEGKDRRWLQWKAGGLINVCSAGDLSSAGCSFLLKAEKLLLIKVQKGTLKSKSICLSKESLGLRFGVAAQGMAAQAVKKGAGCLGGLLVKT